MTKLTTTLRTNGPYAAYQIRFMGNVIAATNVQQAIDSILSVVTNPNKPPNIVAKMVDNSMSPYNQVATDWLIEVDTTAGPVTINLLPSALMDNLPSIVKHIAGDAEANPVTINPNGAETVDGLAPYVIDYNFGSVTLQPKAAGGYAAT